MRQSILEAVCAAQTAPIVRDCPVTAIAPEDAKLHDVPETFIRNIIDLMVQRFVNARRIAAGNGPGDDNHVWFNALEDARSLDCLIQEHLRCVRDENRTFRYTFYAGWQYRVSGPFAW